MQFSRTVAQTTRPATNFPFKCAIQGRSLNLFGSTFEGGERWRFWLIACIIG